MGGAKGTAGGKGGKGGKGGAGAGGPSYAVVTVGMASVSADAASTLTPGKGGLGAGQGEDKAADGESAEQKKF
ncbi:MAG: hypothetical protein EOO70_08020 [Myxococcaceae bacterium]|nr:MAG: hypothetical protein EOO70_08020 [Myxococcaceae bacterium]